MKNFQLLIIVMLVNVAPALSQQLTTKALQKGGARRIEEISSEGHIDYAPVLSADGKTMIFQSNRLGGWRLFESTLKENGTWSEPHPIEAINNYGKKNDLIGGASLSHDGNYLYFFGYFLHQSNSEDLYVSKKGPKGWEKPMSIGASVNSMEYEGFPSISPDNSTLYFIRENQKNPIDKATGESCFTIYKATKDLSGNWNNPKALPSPINMGCERSPKIMDDGKTLLFSSIREGGMGKYDLYQSTLLDHDTWSSPVLLREINTEGNDLSPTITASGKTMYYARDNGFYETEISHKVGPPRHLTVNGFVKNNETGEPLDSEIEIINRTTGETISILINDNPEGLFSFLLTAGTIYEVTFKSEGFNPSSTTYDLTQLTENQTVERHVTFGKLMNVIF